MSALREIIEAAWDDKKVTGRVIEQAARDLGQVREAVVSARARLHGHSGHTDDKVCPTCPACELDEALFLLSDGAPADGSLPCGFCGTTDDVHENSCALAAVEGWERKPGPNTAVLSGVICETCHVPVERLSTDAIHTLIRTLRGGYPLWAASFLESAQREVDAIDRAALRDAEVTP